MSVVKKHNLRGHKVHGYFGLDERKALDKQAHRIEAMGYIVKVVRKKVDLGDGERWHLGVYYKPIAKRAAIIKKLKGLKG
jgi:hypothetical protein